jgi:hypothetical protein
MQEIVVVPMASVPRLPDRSGASRIVGAARVSAEARRRSA